ncbi:MAG: amino acid-binding protein [Verrucomicrobia bacterium]|nr:amino acid-binding protein [Verrucomicrobiota bacterium]
MNAIVEREDVWVASIEDKPGGMAEKLVVLAEAGADLDFIIARRAPDKPGTGVLFVTPLRGDREVRAATALGFSVSSHLHSMRVESLNEPGIAARLTQKVAKAGINLRGFAAAAFGTRFVMHLAFDTGEDVRKAMNLLQQ